VLSGYLQIDFISFNSTQEIVVNVVKLLKFPAIVKKKPNNKYVESHFSLAKNLAIRLSHVAITNAFKPAIQGTNIII